MIKLDAAFLADIHLDRLPPAEAKLMLLHVYETLEVRVGIRLASAMTDQQLDDFEAAVETDEDTALRWLEENVPNYRDVVAQELDQMRVEIRQIAPIILAKSGIVR
jgi:hypothetical protein